MRLISRLRRKYLLIPFTGTTYAPPDYRHTEDEIASIENNLEAVFKAQIAKVVDDGFWPSTEDGVRLVDAFICIRSPERRQSVLEYTLEQVRLELK